MEPKFNHVVSSDLNVIDYCNALHALSSTYVYIDVALFYLIEPLDVIVITIMTTVWHIGVAFIRWKKPHGTHIIPTKTIPMKMLSWLQNTHILVIQHNKKGSISMAYYRQHQVWFTPLLLSFATELNIVPIILKH